MQPRSYRRPRRNDSQFTSKPPSVHPRSRSCPAVWRSALCLSPPVLRTCPSVAACHMRGRAGRNQSSIPLCPPRCLLALSTHVGAPPTGMYITLFIYIYPTSGVRMIDLVLYGMIHWEPPASEQISERASHNGKATQLFASTPSGAHLCTRVNTMRILLETPGGQVHPLSWTLSAVLKENLYI